jgi:hypothetical protein
MKRKPFTTSLREDYVKKIKKLAIDLDLKTNDLIEEGMKLVLEKHGKEASDKPTILNT